MNTSCKNCGFVAPLVQNEGKQSCARCNTEIGSAQSIKDLTDVPTTPLVACAKCRHQQSRGSFACEKCGLRFALARSLQDGARFDGLPDMPTSNILREHWTMLCTKPNDETAHFAFIDLCQSAGHIDFAGYCYREALHDANTQEAQRWQHYQNRVLLRAMVSLTAPRAGNKAESHLLPLFLLVLGGLLIFGLAYLYYHWSQSSSAMLQNSL